MRERINFFFWIITELSLNFLIADDRCGTHKGFFRVAVLKVDTLRLITNFEAGKVQLNVLHVKYLLHMEIFPFFSIFTCS